MKITKSQILILVLVSSVLAVGIYFLVKHLDNSSGGYKNGWDSKKIQTLSDAMYKIMKADPESDSDLIHKACVSPKLADCMATSISKNYPYDLKYAQNPTLNLPTDSKKYIIACFSTCLGTKNNWSKVFYNEVLQNQISSGVSEKIAICYTDYLQKNVDPIDFLNNTANIDSLIKAASATCGIAPTCDCTNTICGQNNSCNQKCDDCSTCICPQGRYCDNGTCKTTLPTCDCMNTTCGQNNSCNQKCDDCSTCICPPNGTCNNGTCTTTPPTSDCTNTTCADNTSCTDCKICACPKGKNCYGSQCLEQTPDCDCSTKNCGTDNGCGGICWNCPSGQLCDAKKCVSIDSTGTQNGWTVSTIQDLATNFMNMVNKDTNILPPVHDLTNTDVGYCMANIISNEYTYDDIVNKKKVPSNYKEILKMCTANDLGIKGQWTLNFYNAMKSYVPTLYLPGSQIQLNCMLNYLRYNYEPNDLNLANIQDALEKAQLSCRI